MAASTRRASSSRRQNGTMIRILVSPISSADPRQWPRIRARSPPHRRDGRSAKRPGSPSMGLSSTGSNCLPPRRLAYSLVLKSDSRTITGLGWNAAAIVPTPSESLLHEEVARRLIVLGQLFDLAAHGRRFDLLRICERHRMDADGFVDDEFHARQPDPVIWQHGRAEGEIRIAEIDHHLGPGPRNRCQIERRDLEGKLAVIDMPDLAFRTGDRDGRARSSAHAWRLLRRRPRARPIRAPRWRRDRCARPDW